MVFSRTCPATLNRDLLLLPADILTVLLIKVQLFQSALRRQLTPTSLQSNYPVSGATTKCLSDGLLLSPSKLQVSLIDRNAARWQAVA